MSLILLSLTMKDSSLLWDLLDSARWRSSDDTSFYLGPLKLITCANN